MPDPVRAWAAVAPDGMMNLSTIRRRRIEAWLALHRTTKLSQFKRLLLHSAGWRVVPVKIVPMEDGDGE